mmetsp:Transcript_136293/g.322899  ORF Transcript_136293/g.322899 Transcript_136293/m.322899 type:complete len:86 (+) Transcript_136293:414-671(+)
MRTMAFFFFLLWILWRSFFDSFLFSCSSQELHGGPPASSPPSCIRSTRNTDWKKPGSWGYWIIRFELADEATARAFDCDSGSWHM